MAKILKVGVSTASGVITGNLAPTVFVNGVPVVVKTAAIAGHGAGIHSAATMVGASTSVYANNKQVCREGDAASCGHTGTSGSSTVYAG
jgi:uncharacterized Zn-binding protein involved in type VI secretion